MRIWHQSVTELEALPQYAESLSRRFAAIAAPGVEVVLHGVPVGTYGSSSPARALEYPRERSRIANVVLSQMERAEREGLLARDLSRAWPTARGLDFLSDLQGMFLP